MIQIRSRKTYGGSGQYHIDQDAILHPDHPRNLLVGSQCFGRVGSRLSSSSWLCSKTERNVKFQSWQWILANNIIFISILYSFTLNIIRIDTRRITLFMYHICKRVYWTWQISSNEPTQFWLTSATRIVPVPGDSWGPCSGLAFRCSFLIYTSVYVSVIMIHLAQHTVLLKKYRLH